MHSHFFLTHNLNFVLIGSFFIIQLITLCFMYNFINEIVIDLIKQLILSI